MNTMLQHHYDEWLRTKLKNLEGEHTSDECYTPEPLYNYIIDWVFMHTRKADGLEICRPFYPGGDYTKEDYTEKVVIDNPPFSILSQIVRFYEEHKVPYFLFGPSLTLLATIRGQATNYIFPHNHDVYYDNGVNVKTGFISNLFDHKIILAADMDLPSGKPKPKKNKVDYPEGIYNSARLSSKAYNAEKTIYYDDISYTTTLPDGKRIFGGGIVTNEYKGNDYRKTNT